MIKCIGYLKSLKQLFIISLISCFILLGNSFVNSEWIFHDANESFSVPNASAFTLRVASSSAGVLDGGGMSSPKPLIMLQSNVSSSKQYRYLYFWGTDNKLYAYGNSAGTPGNSSDYEYLMFDTFYRFSNTGFVNCTYSTLHSCSYSEAVSSESFYSDTSLKGSMTRFAYYFDNSTNNYTTFCWVYDNLGFSICVKPSGASTTELTPVSGLSIDPVEFNADLIGFSPWIDNVQPDPSTGNNQITIGGGMDGYDYTKIDTGDLVFYFENNPYYRYDEGVCYVGTDDFDTLYSSGSTLGLFRANSGGTVFDLFSDKFGDSFSLNNVGAFINAWNINYFTWFKGGNRDENNVPMFNAYYSLSSGFYQDFSDDLIVPFIGNPIAFYFMGYVSSLYGEYATQGQAISTYCYYKLGLDKNSGGLDISDDTSKDYLNNASDFINQRNKFYGLNSGGINIQSQSWSGTILDYFTGGQDNYDFNTFFSSSFNKFKDKISLNLSDLGAGFLPTWIIMFLIAIIFFRFLSH